MRGRSRARAHARARAPACTAQWDARHGTVATTARGGARGDAQRARRSVRAPFPLRPFDRLCGVGAKPLIHLFGDTRRGEPPGGTLHCRVFSASRVVGVRTPLFIFFATPDVGRLAGNFAAREGFCGGGSVSDPGPVRKFLVWAWWWGPPCPRLSRDPGGPVPRPKVTGCSPLTRGAVPRTSTPGRFDSRKVRLGARRPADRSPGSGSGRVAALHSAGNLRGELCTAGGISGGNFALRGSAHQSLPRIRNVPGGMAPFPGSSGTRPS